MADGLLENEQLDDLLTGGRVILQKKDGFRYGTDAVALAQFARIGVNDNVLDIGTGGGILPMLLSLKGGAGFMGIDIVPEMVDMANRSAKMNGLTDRVRFICADVRKLPEVFAGEKFDVVVTNPPYKKAGSGIPSKNYNAYVARHEALCTLEDVLAGAASVMKTCARLYMVNRPDRLCDAMELMRRYGIEPKRLRFVHADPLKAPVMFLVCGVKDAGSELIVEAPQVLSGNGGTVGFSDRKELECTL
ncbi:MAG: methyltransferase domain-containing protein [Clostridia bacterium]|nr:methyltransferase domain-containing protein [Clostridia bacterium]MCR5693454.1 methyltransferase domain-containing protein [Clostridia bacterium]